MGHLVRALLCILTLVMGTAQAFAQAWDSDETRRKVEIAHQISRKQCLATAAMRMSSSAFSTSDINKAVAICQSAWGTRGNDPVSDFAHGMNCGRELDKYMDSMKSEIMTKAGEDKFVAVYEVCQYSLPGIGGPKRRF